MKKILTEETIGQRIKARRIELGMTQQELADALYDGVKSTISAYENDRIDIKCSSMMELAEALHTTPDYLMGYYDRECRELIDSYSNIKSLDAKRLVLAQVKLAGECY